MTLVIKHPVEVRPKIVSLSWESFISRTVEKGQYFDLVKFLALCLKTANVWALFKKPKYFMSTMMKSHIFGFSEIKPYFGFFTKKTQKFDFKSYYWPFSAVLLIKLYSCWNEKSAKPYLLITLRIIKSNSGSESNLLKLSILMSKSTTSCQLQPDR